MSWRKEERMGGKTSSNNKTGTKDNHHKQETEQLCIFKEHRIKDQS